MTTMRLHWNAIIIAQHACVGETTDRTQFIYYVETLQ